MDTVFPPASYSTSTVGADGVLRSLTGTITFDLNEAFPVPPPPITLTSYASGTVSTPSSAISMTLPSANAGDTVVIYVTTDSATPGAPDAVSAIGAPDLPWAKLGTVNTTVNPEQTLEVWAARTPAALTSALVSVGLHVPPAAANAVVMAFSRVSSVQITEGPMVSAQAPAPGGIPLIAHIPCSASGLIVAASGNDNSAPVPPVYAPLTEIAQSANNSGSGSFLTVGSYAPGAAGNFTVLFGASNDYAAGAIVLKNG